MTPHWGFIADELTAEWADYVAALERVFKYAKVYVHRDPKLTQLTIAVRELEKHWPNGDVPEFWGEDE